MTRIRKIFEAIIFHTFLTALAFIIGIFVGSVMIAVSSWGFSKIIHECYGPPSPINTVEINGAKFERKRP